VQRLTAAPAGRGRPDLVPTVVDPTLPWSDLGPYAAAPLPGVGARWPSASERGLLSSGARSVGSATLGHRRLVSGSGAWPAARASAAPLTRS
jgi:hypothetical protein